MSRPASRSASGTGPWPALDLRLLLAAASAWTCCWVAVAAPVPWVAAVGGLACVVAGVLGSLAMRGRRCQGWQHVVLAGLCVGTVLLSSAAQASVRQAGSLPDWVQDRATVRAVVTVSSDPRAITASRFGEPRWIVHAVLDEATVRGDREATAAPVVLLVGDTWLGVYRGQRVALAGTLLPTDPGQDRVALVAVRGPPRPVAAAPSPDRVAQHLRSGLRDATSGLPPDAAGLLPGLVIGDTSRQSEGLAEAMRASGLTHLTAVSGANVTLVCGAAMLLVAGIGGPRPARVVAGAVALAGFVVLAQPEPSVMRAGVMGCLALVGILGARRARSVPVLATAVVVLLVVDPWLARSHGFALSVVATGGLMLLAAPWAARLCRWLPRWAALSVAVPAAAQVACSPVLVLLRPEISLVAVPANLLAAPAVAPATVLGVVTVALAPWWPGAASVVATVAGWAASWIAVVARVGADVPAGAVPWFPGPVGALALVVLLLGFAAWPMLPRGPVRIRVLAGGLAVALVLAGVAAAPRLLRSTWLPEHWWVVACDVGQGDALVISTAPGTAVLVDTGPDPDAVDGCLRDLGVVRLDMVVLTHFHADHVDGLSGAVRDRPVGGVVVSPLADPAAAASDVRDWAVSEGVTVTEAVAGQRGELNDTRFEVLWPTADRVPADANDASVALLVERDGHRVLFTGDLEPAGQAGLARLLSQRPDATVDVLKVAHHGSSAQDERLHRLVAPRVALISSGADNTYGHPAPPTVAMLDGLGTRVLRTDDSGHVAVTLQRGELGTATQRHPDP